MGGYVLALSQSQILVCPHFSNHSSNNNNGLSRSRVLIMMGGVRDMDYFVEFERLKN
jgi:hypothetical protein